MQNKRNRLLFITVFVCLGLLIMDRIVMGPLLEGYKDRAARIVKLQNQIAKGEALLAHRQSYEARWDEMVKNSLPSEQSEAEQMIMGAMTDWSRSGLALNSRRPNWVPDKDGTKHVEFRVLATGSITSIARFLYEVERDSRALRVQDIEIAARDDVGRNLSLNMLLTGAVLRGGR